MQKEDFSKKIFDDFYSTEGKLLTVVLKDKTVLTGTFIAFIPGEKNTTDPYIIKWHFLNEDEIEAFKVSPLKDIERDAKGIIIKQEDIESVNFK